LAVEQSFEAYDYYQRGRELLESRDFRAASVALERAKRLEPDKASIREALGRAYLSARVYRQAAEEFAAAVDLAPTDHYAHFGLGRALERMGEMAAAKRHYKLARCFGSTHV
jgi:tetratricopeptide (TPR) repeat protein